MNSQTGDYHAGSRTGTIKFDFTDSDSLHVSCFFQALHEELEKTLRSDTHFLIFNINGFPEEKSLKNFEVGERAEAQEYSRRCMERILSLRIPVISEIRGFICGPILETVLFSDFIIACRSTIISSLMLEKGYIPVMGMLTNLMELFGKEGLFRFLLDGIDLSSTHPVKISIFHSIIDQEDLDSEVAKLIKTFSERDRHAIRVIKELSLHTRNLHPGEALLLERYNFALCFSEPHVKERIDLFLNKKE
ncbi:MAG: enoyl-CoA hydratase-related protein [Acidobacteriota bacterium]